METEEETGNGSTILVTQQVEEPAWDLIPTICRNTRRFLGEVS